MYSTNPGGGGNPIKVPDVTSEQFEKRINKYVWGFIALAIGFYLIVWLKH